MRTGLEINVCSFILSHVSCLGDLEHRPFFFHVTAASPGAVKPGLVAYQVPYITTSIFGGCERQIEQPGLFSFTPPSVLNMLGPLLSIFLGVSVKDWHRIADRAEHRLTNDSRLSHSVCV